MTDIDREKMKRFQRAAANLQARNAQWKCRVVELIRSVEALGTAADSLADAMDEGVASLLDIQDRGK